MRPWPRRRDVCFPKLPCPFSLRPRGAFLRSRVFSPARLHFVDDCSPKWTLCDVSLPAVADSNPGRVWLRQRKPCPLVSTRCANTSARRATGRFLTSSYRRSCTLPRCTTSAKLASAYPMLSSKLGTTAQLSPACIVRSGCSVRIQFRTCSTAHDLSKKTTPARSRWMKFASSYFH